MITQQALRQTLIAGIDETGYAPLDQARFKGVAAWPSNSKRHNKTIIFVKPNIAISGTFYCTNPNYNEGRGPTESTTPLSPCALCGFIRIEDAKLGPYCIGCHEAVSTSGFAVVCCSWCGGIKRLSDEITASSGKVYRQLDQCTRQPVTVVLNSKTSKEDSMEVVVAITTPEIKSIVKPIPQVEPIAMTSLPTSSTIDSVSDENSKKRPRTPLPSGSNEIEDLKEPPAKRTKLDKNEEPAMTMTESNCIVEEYVVDTDTNSWEIPSVNSTPQRLPPTNFDDDTEDEEEEEKRRSRERVRSPQRTRFDSVSSTRSPSSSRNNSKSRSPQRGGEEEEKKRRSRSNSPVRSRPRDRDSRRESPASHRRSRERSNSRSRSPPSPRRRQAEMEPTRTPEYDDGNRYMGITIRSYTASLTLPMVRFIQGAHKDDTAIDNSIFVMYYFYALLTSIQDKHFYVFNYKNIGFEGEEPRGDERDYGPIKKPHELSSHVHNIRNSKAIFFPMYDEEYETWTTFVVVNPVNIIGYNEGIHLRNEPSPHGHITPHSSTHSPYIAFFGPSRQLNTALDYARIDYIRCWILQVLDIKHNRYTREYILPILPLDKSTAYNSEATGTNSLFYLLHQCRDWVTRIVSEADPLLLGPHLQYLSGSTSKIRISLNEMTSRCLYTSLADVKNTIINDVKPFMTTMDHKAPLTPTLISHTMIKLNQPSNRYPDRNASYNNYNDKSPTKKERTIAKQPRQHQQEQQQQQPYRPSRSQQGRQVYQESDRHRSSSSSSLDYKFAQPTHPAPHRKYNFTKPVHYSDRSR